MAATSLAGLLIGVPGAGAQTGGIVAGLDVPGGSLSAAVSELGRTPALLNTFSSWVQGGSPNPFPTTFANTVVGMGSTPMITWQPNLPTYATKSVLTSIADGSQDAYIRSWASAAAAVHHKVYVRLMHEFNGRWYPWGAVVAGQTLLSYNQLDPNPPAGTYPYTNTPQMFVAAYQHVADVFRSVGASNVEFVWCAASGGALSSLSSYYPGDASVAWGAVDGYNRSTTAPRSLQTVFTKSYAAVAAATTKPLMIAETASVEYTSGSSPTTKAAWATQGFLTTIPTLFPRVQAVNWFDSDTNGFTYSIDSSSSALQAIRQVYASSQYQASAP